ncbi:glycosyltransferase family 4 protein [Litoribacter alkaliphilus]|uniref:Glycosyltransferase family 4 protein n=1 Tax=Litoribacter ruber TaxID=702568 RepID=A0AAP2CLF5_9BACT|nr:glycosyltransferase family 4 protein [Litoribacter alkaliphilus]MBS9525884.1 glycosyltransferase family 4 protein [Litoribacter alkaliphilus]
MRILKILSGNDGGGVYQCEQQFIKYWIQKGVEVDAIIIGEGGSSETYKRIVNSYFTLPRLNLSNRGITPFNELNNIRKVHDYNRKAFHLIDKMGLTRYDAVIFRRHFFTKIASRVSKLLKVELYWHMPISVNGVFEKFYFSRLAKKYDIKVIGNSEYSMNSIGSVSNDFVYPGFNNDRIARYETKPSYRDNLSIPKDSAVFGVAARITKRKAQHLLIEAFTKLLRKYKNVHLLVAGGPLDTHYAKHCIKLAQEFKSNIHFIGQVEIMAEFYASIDVYVNSRIDAEPFGISIAESLGSGLPVIAFKKGGPSEMIIPGKNGWLIDTPKTYSYYMVLQNAIENKQKWKKMGEFSRNYSDKFSSVYNANKFFQILKNN